MTDCETPKYLAWVEERENVKARERDVLVWTLMQAEEALTAARDALKEWDAEHES